MLNLKATAALTVSAAALTLSACQDGTKLIVENRCGIAIEVDMDDVADPVALGYDIDWTQVSAGETASIRTASDRLRRVYVWVRIQGSSQVPVPLVFEPAELSSAADGEHKAVAVIEGDRCPSA